jgi:hypothetical protein
VRTNDRDATWIAYGIADGSVIVSPVMPKVPQPW